MGNSQLRPCFENSLLIEFSRYVARERLPTLDCVTKMASRIAKSPYSVDIPSIDIPSYVFSSGTSLSREAPQFFNAATPSRCFSLAEAEGIVKRFASGLQYHGLQPGDRALLYSGNHLFFPIVLWGIVAAGGIFTAASPTATVSGKILVHLIHAS